MSFHGIYYNHAASNQEWIRRYTKIVCIGACKCQDGKKRVAYIASFGDQNKDFIRRKEAEAWIQSKL
jgi:hypothetical protein